MRKPDKAAGLIWKQSYAGTRVFPMQPSSWVRRDD